MPDSERDPVQEFVDLGRSKAPEISDTLRKLVQMHQPDAEPTSLPHVVTIADMKARRK